MSRLFAAALALSLLAPAAAAAGKLDARALIKHIETQHLGKTSKARARMKVKTEYWSRTLVMDMWGEGRDKFLVTIRSPKKEKGTGSLKIIDDLWNYLPKIDRLMKVPSSLMGDSWMGSHFTNDDVVKEYKIDELYVFEVLKDDGKSAVVSGVPREDAAVVWGRIEYHVDLKKRVPTSVKYFDEDGELVRVMDFDQVEKISGRWIPMRMVIKPVEDPDELTEFIYDSLELDVPLKKGLFSIRSLRRRR